MTTQAIDTPKHSNWLAFVPTFGGALVVGALIGARTGLTARGLAG